MNMSTEKRSLEANVLGIFPPFLRRELVANKAFRDELGIKVQSILTIGVGGARFRRDKLFDAIRSALADQSTAAIHDESGTSYSVMIEVQGNGSTVVTATQGDTHLRLSGLAILSTDRAQRLLEFDFALVDAGLPPNGLPEWRVILEQRPIEDDELGELLADLSRTPQSCIRALDNELSGPDVKLETIAPADPAYYERLVGVGDACSASELAGSASSRIADLLAWDTEQGARVALLLASHAGVIAESPLSSLPSDALARLGEWAKDGADLVSKIGMIELGLAVLPSSRHLEPMIEALVREIIELNPDDAACRLNFLSAGFVLIDAELSRTKALGNWPPFRRRFAALAQASLVERVGLGRIDVESFSKWAFGQRGHRFYLQTLVDMRLEPRWLPDYAGPDQLHCELIGRIHNAGYQFAPNVPPGSLHQLLFSDDPMAVQAAINFPASFLPGPLEGSLECRRNPVPAHFEAILNESLAGEQFEPKSVTALINLRGLFHFDNEKIARTVSMIRAAGHRINGDVSLEERDALIHGLAGVAAITRSTDLACDVRVMMRKNRIDGLSPPRPGCELLIGLHAAAAYEESEAWRKFIGDWAGELAFGVSSKGEAQELHTWLTTLCVIEPALRKTIGCGLAALAAYIEV
ncbi:hypothetical protein CCR94_13825 [Rhodoblastus sphagnicola]|uniref:GreAB-C-like domain-containing protein n=2 Tax=Rhodoblastus sphagnicola TaxID=333368 RepID=A0A2S6N5N6_9HYPH|nr:hypothetical protein [Rhodoblastus sphagnicola]PPQ29935.1 hypothetical protein CCR94_13825 [Rhodoblastus sphagnicola]